MSNDQTVKNSLNDLAYVQRLLKKIESSEFSLPLNKFAVDINIFIQALCLVVALGFAIYELTTGGQITSSMLLASNDSELAFLGMNTVALILLALVVVFYYLVWRASVAAQRDFYLYLEANFKFLKNLSLVSDLLVKFVGIYLLVYSGQSRYVSVLLILFIGDYLIQGRYFNLPLKNSIFAGAVSFILCPAVFYFKLTALIYPLALFILMSGFSLAYLLKNKKTVSLE